MMMVFILIALPMILNSQNAMGWIPGVEISGISRSPTTPNAGQSVVVTLTVWYDRSPSYLVGDLYYRVNGGSEVKVTMTRSSNTLQGTIPGRPLGDVVEYQVHMRAEQEGYLYGGWSPSSSSYHTYVVSEPYDIAWSSPDPNTEITFGPETNDITFDFDWTYLNLDNATLQIGDEVTGILPSGVKSTSVDLVYGPDLEGSSIPAILRGYKSQNLVASDTRYFSFRRLDYGVNWETPSDGNIIAFSPTGLAKFNFSFSQGADVNRVELFFNDTAMSNVTSPNTVEFDFMSFAGTIKATLKSYDSDDNEMANDTRIFTFRRLVFEVIWETPSENESLVFGTGSDPVLFNFTYSQGTDVDYVKLELNGLDMGVVINPGTVSFDYNDSFHDDIVAILRGYNSTHFELSNSVRYFTFDKMVDTRFEILQQNETTLGEKLYLILHDPNGDDSTSSYEESTTLSMGIGCEITAGVTAGLEVGIEQEGSFFGLFKTGAKASNKLSLSMETSLGFDARFEMTDSTFLTSSDSSHVDFIGPGYGDRYWGELWILKYVFTVHYIEYYNGTEVYYDPHLWWGILRDKEVIRSDASAPAEWKAMNPVHNGYSEEDVEWLGGTLVADGGGTYFGSETVTNTNTMSSSISIGIESETKAKLMAGGAYVEGSLELSLNTKIYADVSASNTIKTSYTIRDDDPLDSVVQKIGIDKNFGTYIFKTESEFSATSNPIEHNTRDYVPPNIGYPTVICDTDQDFKGPTPNDNPLVTVKIEEEGGVQSATLYYSNDNGTSWRSTPLIEYQGQPGVWATNIPKQTNNTEVIWYIKAIDMTGNSEEKYDLTGEYFSYEVGILVNPLIAQTPGFSIWTVLASIGLCVYFISKRRD
jgi:hypothetical protein